ncbi:MAG: chemotaxis protein CheB [Eubacteriales bacterium]
MEKTVKVLVIDDSAVTRQMIIRGLRQDKYIDVVSDYSSDQIYLFQKESKPIDLVICDFAKLKCSPSDLLADLALKANTPVIATSNQDVTHVKLPTGEIADFVQKPTGNEKIDPFVKKLTAKVLALTEAKQLPSSMFPDTVKKTIPLLGDRASNTVICIGASTGGTEATLEVLQQLPSDMPPIVMVQHMPLGFTKMYAERLDRLCQMKVYEGSDGAELSRGVAYVAPAGVQTRILQHGDKMTLSCLDGPKVSGHRPSVDALFESFHKIRLANKVAIILTGMGRDGAEGILKLRQQGAYTIGQDKESSVVYGMPMEAFELGGIVIQASCAKIPDVLLNRLRKLS